MLQLAAATWTIFHHAPTAEGLGYGILPRCSYNPQRGTSSNTFETGWGRSANGLYLRAWCCGTAESASGIIVTACVYFCFIPKFPYRESIQCTRYLECLLTFHWLPRRSRREVIPLIRNEATWCSNTLGRYGDPSRNGSTWEITLCSWSASEDNLSVEEKNAYKVGKHDRRSWLHVRQERITRRTARHPTTSSGWRVPK